MSKSSHDLLIFIWLLIKRERKRSTNLIQTMVQTSGESSTISEIYFFSYFLQIHEAEFHNDFNVPWRSLEIDALEPKSKIFRVVVVGGVCPKDKDLVFCRKTCKFIRSRRPSDGRRSIRRRQVSTQLTIY